MTESHRSQTRQVRLLDVGFELNADVPGCFSLLDTLYQAPEFRPSGAPPDVVAPFRNDPTTGPSVLTTTGNGEPLEPAGGLSMAIAEWTFRAFLERSRQYHLVHAGSLARDSGGVLVVGPPYAGKTTLTLALCQEGFRYYSDDVGAIARADGRLHPFRRSAGVRLDGGGRKYVSSGPEPGSENVFDGCRLGWVFVLDAPRPADFRTPGAWTLIFETAGSETLPSPPPGSGLSILSRRLWGGGLRVDLAPISGGQLATAVRSWLGPRPRGLLFLGPTPRDWEALATREPSLHALSATDAALEVLRHTLNRAGRDHLETRYGKHPHLKVFAELLETLSGVRCFTLKAGAPDTTARFLRTFVESGGAGLLNRNPG